MQDELDGDAGLDKDDDDDMENMQHETDDDEHVEVRAGGKKDKTVPDAPHRRKSKNRQLRETRGCLPQRGAGLQRMLGRVLLARGLGQIPYLLGGVRRQLVDEQL
uniref:Uncharacterized protein n=1 Tax=Triticum urartu TaxID=4572 RepID=A0A8R7VFV0_TRIUA